MGDTHTTWMNHAAKLALKGTGQAFPNPMVGAVLIKNQQIIGQGYHPSFGAPHAEIEALNNAKKNNFSPEGATLYVTLEPCCHHGKTPPCTGAILENKIAQVFYALKDPNPKVSGQGTQFLEQNNIKTTLFSTPQTDQLNSIYKAHQQKRPFIHLKTACTLDHKIPLKKNQSTPLTNPISNKKTHELRAQYDAILVGADTALIDNPSLTTRHVQGKNPIRIILDSNLKTPPSLKLFQEPGQTIIATTKKPSKTYSKNTTILTCKPDQNNHVDLHDLLIQLFEQQIHTILVEGGQKLSTSFLEENLVDQLTLIYTPHLAKNPSLPSFPTNKIKSPKHITTSLIQNNLWVEILPY
ncbi:bifunctional diaminohydroxyphosphoribosylaminopyrimidine deaminase/5-amino-6-(5-phosphoribosylamino)uracil reductase RibD [Candidatus Peregrinibacteria bacterium]|nr:bifunctional diaminohydroxyphosphoribosylaminopyrimidine deaminase/5-amino-6-(5-phosphoribosylamino)uracil reductase RibD [Candidatus Peregrinibacteria bacterium]